MKHAKILSSFAAFALLLASANAQSWLTNGLIAFYPLDGNANDASGNANNGIVTGAMLSPDKSGKTNACYKFNGVSDKMLANIPNIPRNAQDRTLSLWLKCTANVKANAN